MKSCFPNWGTGTVARLMHICTLRAGGKSNDWIEEECRGPFSQWHKHTQPAHDDHLQLGLATEE